MLLIIEIILTVFVWRNGWRWLSLIPLGVAFLIGMIIGVTGTTDAASYMIFDVLAIVALIIMLAKKPKSNIDEKEDNVAK